MSNVTDSGKPKVYGTCAAGCLHEVVRMDDYKSGAIKVDNAGNADHAGSAGSAETSGYADKAGYADVAGVANSLAEGVIVDEAYYAYSAWQDSLGHSINEYYVAKSAITPIVLDAPTTLDKLYNSKIGEFGGGTTFRGITRIELLLEDEDHDNVYITAPAVLNESGVLGFSGSFSVLENVSSSDPTEYTRKTWYVAGFLELRNESDLYITLNTFVKEQTSTVYADLNGCKKQTMSNSTLKYGSISFA